MPLRPYGSGVGVKETVAMRFSRVVLTLCIAGMGISAQDPAGDIWQMESKGDAQQASERLRKAVEASPNDAGALRAYAEFLDRHRDPATRAVYATLDQALASNAPERASVLRRIVIPDLLAGDRDAATRHLAAYREAGGSGLSLPAAVPVSPKRSKITSSKFPAPCAPSPAWPPSPPKCIPRTC